MGFLSGLLGGGGGGGGGGGANAFNSASQSTNSNTTDSRNTQAGRDVNQTNVTKDFSISTGKKSTNNINITETDHGAIAAAFSFGDRAIETSLDTVNDLVDNMSNILGRQQKQNSESLERLAISSNTNGGSEVIDGNIKMIALLLLFILIGAFIYFKVAK